MRETLKSSPATDPVVVLPGQGKEVQRLYGERTIIKASSADTRDAYAVRENVIPAGFSGVPHHIHHGAEEAFYVLEGALTIATPDRTVNAPAGSFVLIPRGTVHTLANPGSVPARWLTIISPAWVSAWVEEEDVLLRNAPPGGPDPGEQAAIYRKYGLELVSQGDLTDD